MLYNIPNAQTKINFRVGGKSGSSYVIFLSIIHQMKNIAYVTSDKDPQLTTDDKLAIPFLEQRGITVTATIWDEPLIDWKSFEAVIIRSPWDYYTKAQNFRRWLDSLEQDHVNVWNPVSVVRWNTDKNYLSRFRENGIRIIPTEFYKKGAALNLAVILQRNGWKSAVVKPAVSASGYQTYVVDGDRIDEHLGKCYALLEEKDILVQEFMPEILNEGEWSMVFFGKKFSHAVRKRPGKGEFRVQEHIGGSAERGVPPARLLEEASKILSAVPESLLYSRIDGIERGGKFWLMEAELTEPTLYLIHDPTAPERFANAVSEILK
jgi:glutathione synthase/RimK-type ligase-like ATP-grasp enzyme